MKKILVLTVLLFLFVSFQSFALIGIGGAFAIDPIGSAIPGAALSIQYPDLAPFLLGVGFSIGSDTFQIGLTGDYWFVKDALAGALSYYVGLGGYLQYAGAMDFGLRVPVGIQIWPLNPLELFVEVAPSVGIVLSDPIVFPNWGIQGAFGFRFWFD
ncbi:MAG: hypothetical protein ACLFR1_12760 [Spirochaetia bacterium]